VKVQGVVYGIFAINVLDAAQHMHGILAVSHVWVGLPTEVVQSWSLVRTTREIVVLAA
jgi:hypothetical protein